MHGAPIVREEKDGRVAQRKETANWPVRYRWGGPHTHVYAVPQDLLFSFWGTEIK